MAKFQTDLNNKVIANVKFYGAKGDGVTNDTDAIQRAIDSGYKFVYLPEGTYWITGTLSIIGKNSLHLYGAGANGGTRVWFSASSPYTGSMVRLAVSSECVISDIGFDSRPVSRSEAVPGTGSQASYCAYGFQLDSNGGQPITMNNRLERCDFSWFYDTGIQFGDPGPVDVDVNTDVNSIIDCNVSWCGLRGIRVMNSNTNHTTIRGGTVGECGFLRVTGSGIEVDRNARGVFIDNVMLSLNGEAEITLTNRQSGPVTIRNIVTELYGEKWLKVYSSGGLDNTSPLTIESIYCSSNPPASATSINPVIDYTGFGAVTIRNAYFAGGMSVATGALSGGALSFQPSNAPHGGAGTLITENVTLADGARWDVQTYNSLAHYRWMETATTYMGNPASQASLSATFVRTRGGLPYETDLTLSTVMPPSATINSYGRVARSVYKVTLPYTCFSASASLQQLAIVTFPSRTLLVGAVADTTQAFSGSIFSGSLVLSVEASTTGDVILAHNVQATGTKGLVATDLGAKIAPPLQGTYLSWGGNAQVFCTLSASSGTLGASGTTNLSSGSVTVYLISEVLP